MVPKSFDSREGPENQSNYQNVPRHTFVGVGKRGKLEYRAAKELQKSTERVQQACRGRVACVLQVLDCGVSLKIQL